MKKLYCLFVSVCMSAFVASSLMGADGQDHQTQGGVEVVVQHNPLGPNNAIVAYIKFINNNQFRIEVNWTPVITCAGEKEREGPATSFSMNGGERSVVNIWRLTACGNRPMEGLRVKMDVKKAEP